jgi:hypothetical protein
MHVEASLPIADSRFSAYDAIEDAFKGCQEVSNERPPSGSAPANPSSCATFNIL